MRVEVWVRDALVQQTTAPTRHRLVATWEDADARTPRAAASRAWHVCAMAPHTLTEAEQAWRAAFDARALGYGLSVGDIVVCGDAALRVDADGFTPVNHP